MFDFNKHVDLPDWESTDSRQNGGHYYLAMRPDILRLWALAAQAHLSAMLLPADISPIFCYSGMSGVAYATALALEWEMRHGDLQPYHMCYVRKQGEKAHTGQINTTGPLYDRRPKMFVFVDDSIDSGNTINYTMGKVVQASKNTITRPVWWNSFNRDLFLILTTHKLALAPLKGGKPW